MGSWEDTGEVRLRSLFTGGGMQDWMKQWDIKVLLSAQKVSPWPGALWFSRWHGISVSSPHWAPGSEITKSGQAFWVKLIWSITTPHVSWLCSDSPDSPNSSTEPAAPLGSHHRENAHYQPSLLSHPITAPPRQTAKCTAGLPPSFAYSTVTKVWAAEGLTTHFTQKRPQSEKADSRWRRNGSHQSLCPKWRSWHNKNLWRILSQ